MTAVSNTNAGKNVKLIQHRGQFQCLQSNHSRDINRLVKKRNDGQGENNSYPDMPV